MKRLTFLVLGALFFLTACATPALAQHTVLCANDPTCVTTVLSGGGDVVAAGNNAFTGTNSFATHSTNFTFDPVIDSGGSTTDGALCFGKTGGLATCTGSSTRFVEYSASIGGTGGYSFGNTYGSADNLYLGGLVISNAGSNAVTVKPGASGNWTLTLPTGAGTNGYLLSTDGSGNTSWIAGSGSGTVTSVATSTGLTGGPITASGTITCNTMSSSTIGCAKVDGTTTTTSGGIIALKGPTIAGGFGYFAMGIDPSNAHMSYLEYGGAAMSGASLTVTWPQALFTGVGSLTATAVDASGLCQVAVGSTSTTQGVFKGNGACTGQTVLWQMIGS